MHLLRAIERHISRHGIAPTRFGRDAVGDPRLVHDLRRGREPGRRMVERVTRYMAQTDADSPA